ncbi:MAG: DNA cytosine methyltransferase, partial [bacterium]|nr:DNA cytosine methyltransferase [bacterium]
NNPESRFINTDINELKPRRLQELTGIKKNDDSMVFIGCSPCQYWTHINTVKEKSSGTKNLLMEFQRFVDYFKPGHIIIENVPGMLTRRTESNLDIFLDHLAETSYAFKYGIINANHYGVPQNRKRFILIASRLRPTQELPKPQKAPYPVVKDIIGHANGFREIQAGHIDESPFMHTTANLSEKNIRRLKLTPVNGGTRAAWKDDPELQINAYRGKDHIFRDVYGRMYWEKPAPTITTKFIRTSNGRFSHPEEHRGLSLREGAALQTFSNEYIFLGANLGSIAKQIGNAVPPKLAQKNKKPFWRAI